jgi:hypothetical protein
MTDCSRATGQSSYGQAEAPHASSSAAAVRAGPEPGPSGPRSFGELRFDRFLRTCLPRQAALFMSRDGAPRSFRSKNQERPARCSIEPRRICRAIGSQPTDLRPPRTRKTSRSHQHRSSPLQPQSAHTGSVGPPRRLLGPRGSFHFHQLDARDRLRVQSRKTDKAAERTRQLRWQRTQQCQAARCAPSFALRRSKDRLPDRHISIGQSRRAITPIECSPGRLAVQRIRIRLPTARG